MDQPEAVWEYALKALYNLACAAENQVPMWQRDDVQAVLLGGAAVDQPEAVRLKALGGLRILTRNLSIQPSLVQAGVRDLLDDARAHQHFLPDVRGNFDESFQRLVGVLPPPTEAEVAAEADAAAAEAALLKELDEEAKVEKKTKTKKIHNGKKSNNN